MFGPAFSQFNPGRRGGTMAPTPIITGFNFRVQTINLTDAQLRALSSVSLITAVPAVPGSVLWPAWMAYAANITAGFSVARTMALRWDNAAATVLIATGSNQYVDTVIRVNEWVVPAATGTGLLITSPPLMSGKALMIAGSGAAVTGGSTSFGGRLRIGYYVIPLSDT